MKINHRPDQNDSAFLFDDCISYSPVLQPHEWCLNYTSICLKAIIMLPVYACTFELSIEKIKVDNK